MDGSSAEGGRTVQRGLTQAQFQSECLYTPLTTPGVCDRVRRSCQPSSACVRRCLTRRLPILAWLPSYDPGRDLVGDVIAGVTTAIVHIPQGMAYAQLAGIPAINGIYMAFFQCLIYAALGTSRHLSVGTFAVSCIMTGHVVLEHSSPRPDSADRGTQYDPVLVATTVTLAVGIVQLVMFALRLSALSVVLSDMLVQGFTTGAAVHVLFSQLPGLLGLQPPHVAGAGRLVKVSVLLMKQLSQTNITSLLISAITIFILVLNNECLKPKLASWTRVPVPVELLVVMAGTAVSYGCDLAGQYHVQVIGHVTTGLPQPSRPALELLSQVLLDAAVIAVVTYTAGMSMASLLARKHEYTVDPSQELLAQGVANVMTAWLSCAPVGASLSRSLIVDSAGGRTQASGIITALLLLSVLLWLGPLFQLLPKCVLSAVIVVSLKGLLRQPAALPRLWRASRADAAIWLGTLAAVVTVDIASGLAAGAALSVATLLWRHQRPPAELLGRVPGTELYLPLQRYRAAQLEADICVFRFGGALHFCNSSYFRGRLAALTGLEVARQADPEGRGRRQRRRSVVTNRRHRTRDKGDDKELLTPLTEEDTEGVETNRCETPGSYTIANGAVLKGRGTVPDVDLEFSHLVLDMSMVSFTDTSSTRELIAVIREYQNLGVTCHLAGCNESVLAMVRACSSGLEESRLFPTVYDAVLAIRAAQTATETSLEHVISEK